MPTAIFRDEVRRLVEEGAQLVDVLSRQEYEDEHLPRAINIPLKELDRETQAGRASHRLLPRLPVRHEPTSRVAARRSRFREVV